MGKASSSKKVARVAKVGGKAGHRTTRPLGYPLSVAALIVIGLALVAFVKVHRTAQDNTPPRQTVTDANGNVTKTGDHFHEAIGFNVCGKWVPDLKDSAAASTNGIHTLGDGIISIQPTTPDAAGKNARLQLFLADVGVTLTNDTLAFPAGVQVPAAGAPDSSTTTAPASTTTAPTTTAPASTTTAPGATTTVPGSTTTTTAPAAPASFPIPGKCDGKPAVLRVAEWTESFGGDGRTPTSAPPSHIYKSSFGSIRLNHDLASLTVYYGPEDAKIPLPESTPNLLHLQDLGQSPASTIPAVPGVPNSIPGASTPGSSPANPDTSTPGSSAPSGSTPATAPPASSTP